MFEHLGSVPETRKKKKLFSRGYMVVLLIALMVYTVIDSSVSGPQVAASYQEKGVQAIVYGLNKQNFEIVNHSHGNVFDFFIEVANPETKLSSIKFKVHGDYDPDLLSKIVLYQGSVQLGYGASIEDDYILFDINDYELPNRKNHFYLLLSEGDVADVDNKFYFSIENRNDLFLSFQDKSFTAQGNYPILSQEISIVENGRLLFANSFDNDDAYALSNQEVKIASFNLSSETEKAYLYKLVMSYDSTSEVNFSDVIFRLEQDNSLIAQARIDKDSQSLVFDLDKFVPIKNNQVQQFAIKADSLPEGLFDFNLSLMATGYFSGKNIGIENIKLNKIIVRENYPIIVKNNVDEKLKEGWNKFYSLDIIPAKDANISLKKLTFKLENSGVDIQDVRLTWNGQTYQLGFNYKNDELEVIWPEALEIDNNQNTLNLLLKLDKPSQGSSINSYLLVDTVDSRHNIWEYLGTEYNSYLLPGLPLEPQFLK